MTDAAAEHARQERWKEFRADVYRRRTEARRKAEEEGQPWLEAPDLPHAAPFWFNKTDSKVTETKWEPHPTAKARLRDRVAGTVLMRSPDDGPDPNTLFKAEEREVRGLTPEESLARAADSDGEGE